MSETNDLNTTNLSIPEDAFDQFQANSMYMEEEYITLSDIVSPEPSVKELPSDFSEIPFDNEVVVSGNDVVPNTDSLPGTATIDSADSTIAVDNENGFSFQETTDLPPDQLNEGRPKRARKKKSYADNFFTDESNDVRTKSDPNNEIDVHQPLRKRRGRKPKKTIAQNEIIDQDGTNNTSVVPQQKKRGRKKVTKQFTTENSQSDDAFIQQEETLSENVSEEVTETSKTAQKRGKKNLNTSSETPDSKPRKRGKPKKKPLDENTNNDSETLDNKTLGESISDTNFSKLIPQDIPPKKKPGRRKKICPEQSVQQSSEIDISTLEEQQPQETIESVTENSIKSDVTLNKKPGKRGRQKKVQENILMPSVENNVSDDDLDNISLKTLSMKNEDNIKPLDSETAPQPNEKCENLETIFSPNECDIEDHNVDVVDMELDEPVASLSLELVNKEGNDNISKVIENGDVEIKSEIADDSLSFENKSKRPPRRRARKIMHYEEESDEDPFANVELSDDEPGGKKGRYYSDDEYIPGSESKKGNRNRKNITSEEDSDVSDIDEVLEEVPNVKRKRLFSTTKSPRGKKNKKGENDSKDINVTTIAPNCDGNPDDIEFCLQSSVIHANDNATKKSVFTSEFESFLAQKIQGTNIKIKKVTSEQSSQNAPLEIPVLDLESKKPVDASVQTNIIKTTSSGVQTNNQNELPMKDNVALTSEQSEKACEFLKSIVKTTSELGQLMTEKSEDFISKKINVNHVTDTFKMDYCVKKSFLLLKLAKHNIVQMEDDLSKQYEEFLNHTNLISYRQKQKVIKPKEKDDDSDCEIVEQTPAKNPGKPKTQFNPKTVFLNKELSIKIAKKPVSKTAADKCKETLNIKNKNQVWISDSVMVKKVKPTQSFLAQDSRNKKPPDNFVTEKMVSDFFDTYYKKMAPSICAPFTSIEWQGFGRNYVCNYFYVKPDPFSVASTSITNREEIRIENNNNDADSENNVEIPKSEICVTPATNPVSLVTLCTKVLKTEMGLFYGNTLKNDDQQINFEVLHHKIPSPNTLFRLCLKVINKFQNCLNNNISISDLNEDKQGKELTVHTSHTDTALPEVESGIAYPNVKETELSSVFEVGICKNLPDVDRHALIDNETKIIYPCDEETNEKLNDESGKRKKRSGEIQILPLKTMCFKKVKELFFVSIEGKQSPLDNEDTTSECSFMLSETSSYDLSDRNYMIDDMIAELDSVVNTKVGSLFSLCIKYFQKQQRFCVKNIEMRHDQKRLKNDSDHSTHNNKETPNSLKLLTLNIVSNMLSKNICLMSSKINTSKQQAKVPVFKVKTLADICFEIISTHMTCDSGNEQIQRPDVGMTINCVNTLSEEAFHNIEEENMEDNDGENFYDEDNYDFNNFEDEQDTENNWVSQLQMQELKPCIEPNIQSSENQILENRTLGIDLPNKEPEMPRVKLEPVDEQPETIVDSNIVKSEPIHNDDQMTIIPESIFTKQERTEDTVESGRGSLQRQNSSSYDIDTFESFVSRNKMMHPLDEPDNDIFAQSGLKVRRQHEPDYVNEYDPSLNLLIPQTFEPLSVENAKGVLMESSDEENTSQKTNAKKKPRGRPKKGETKQQNKEPVSSKQNQETKTSLKGKGKVPIPEPVNEVAMLTRRMREKIRQEEKKVESSESEEENILLSKMKEKDRKGNDKSITSVQNNEIQCSNVDSTAQIDQNDSNESDKNFTGFSTVDQNEISTYQKYVKFVYDQILPKDTDSTVKHTNRGNNEEENPPAPGVSDEIEDTSRSDSPLINYDEPVEMLECEPTMPIFDNTIKKTKERKKPKTKTKDFENTLASVQKNDEQMKAIETESTNDVNEPKYTERDGWHCYAIGANETKLYQNAAIFLEKLPESFVETYFEYQELTNNQVEDKEVDRLINLNTLNRSSIKEVQKLKGKGKMTKDTTITSRTASPTSDGCAELTASEDEGVNVDDEIPPTIPLKHANENKLAKNSLMGDSDSESGAGKVKEELRDDTQSEDLKTLSKKGSKKGKGTKQNPSPVKAEHPESLMLTADKMMNKELNLLHAPVVFDNEIQEQGDKGPSKNKLRKSLRGHTSREHMKNDEDSSSEEEKQWVSTKEKLLRRMGKKQDTTNADDAKRNKLVSEFIERRGVAAEVRSRGGRGRGKRRRNSRKVLEREKQMRVLSHELFGTPVDGALMGSQHGRFSQSYFKGRRNIRKVIDKKSLARSTVIANMEEFERKCRLNQRQAQLIELLGCEEGVNVLVINDEVCLEYCFEEQRPVVSVHPFFTRVMKAHQYEGVKFMWDACFESLEKVESGHPGGGCILAHCMGLGKTLQVLALLHTVLTHPRVGMQRILVCCPLSTVLNWVDEIHKWIGPVTDQIKVFELSKLKKTYERAYQLEDWYSGGGIFIIGYELFRSLTTLDPEFDDIRPTIVNKIRTALLDPGPDIIVCDEGHLLKNDCSVLAVAMSRVATKRRIVLTGTPMQNNLREYYCMVNFVKPNLLGTYSEYSNRFENPIMNGQHRDSQEEDIKLMKQRTHILHKVLEGCLQRQEASVLYPYLPKKHEYTVFISLTKVQWELYKHYINNYSNNCKQSILKDFHMLQKIWSHPQVMHNFLTKRRDEANSKIKPEKLEDDLAHEDLTHEELSSLKSEVSKPSEAWWLQFLDGGSMLNSLECSNKFVVVFKILNECIALGDKVLIFSTSLYTLDSLEYFLKKINKWSLGQEYYRLDGSVPAEVRQKWCREYNAEHNLKTKLFLISTRAGCLGLNMVAANRVIILDTSWNPAHDIQSIFRVYRFGQKKDCYIYRLVALGTMEQKIYERSVTKQAISCRVVDEQQIDRHYNLAELTELYKYDEQGLSVAGGVAAGVTDVPLLRVARLAALHAVHEHDSLLRGSSEQQLPEHERAAAWMQFQQEHAHKQMQNQLTSSFSINLPTTPISLTPTMQTYQQLVEGSSLTPEIKTDIPNLLQPRPSIPNKAKKYGRKRKQAIETPPEEPLTKEAEVIQESMANQITNILIKNNFQNRRGPKEIAELVSTVRKIVANGKVPKGSFEKSVAQEIAMVLLNKDQSKEIPVEEPPPVQEQAPVRPEKRRGRSRKQTFDTVPNDDFPPAKPTLMESLSLAPGRRRAAINAEKQIDNLKDSIIEPEDKNSDLDTDWNYDSGPEEIVPESQPQKKTSKAVTIKTETRPILDENVSILLSDDDEPASSSVVETPTEKPEAEDITPLHPSLLSNKNFIKIIAHTYLDGNHMLDEDAATLAAQYSTLKARKELEATGKPITCGPIYEIAIKVLGVDILKKLHKTNPPVKPAETDAVQVKTEPEVTKPPAETKKPDKEISKPEIETRKPDVKARKSDVEARKPVPEVRRPSARLKAKKIGDLTEKRSPTPSVSQPDTPEPSISVPAPAKSYAGPKSKAAVVPVGLIHRQGSIAPNVTPVAPTQQFAPPLAEESILPDDDDVILGDTPPPKNIFKKSAKPLIINSVLAANGNIPAASIAPPQPKIPKLVISAGKLLPVPTSSLVSSVKPATQVPATICLDSDEETQPDPLPVSRSRRKRVATKSTAKSQVAPALAPKPAPAPVPVSITAANPQLNALLSQQQQAVSNAQINAMLNLNYAQQYTPPQIPMPQVSGGTITLGYAEPTAAGAPLLGNGNFMMVPSTQMTSHPEAPQPYAHQSNQHFAPQTTQNYAPQMGQNYTPQTAPNYAPQMAQNYASQTTQNYAPQTTQNYAPQTTQNYAPHHSTQNYAPQSTQNYGPQTNQHFANQTSTYQNYAPPQNVSMPPSQMAPRAPTPGSQSKKTVCKPGDILRVTKNGTIEVLNREDQSVSVVNDDGLTAPPQLSKTRSRRLAPAPSAPTPPVTPQPTNRPAPKSFDRSRKVSLSSSSSNESRPGSPEDPLSILKDVVHIKAPEEEYPRTTIINKTSTAKPTGSLKPSTLKQSQNDIMKQISKTDTILKKLDKALAPPKPQPSTQKSSLVIKSKNTGTAKTIDTIDLDSYVSSNIKPPAKQATKQAAPKPSPFRTSLEKSATKPKDSGAGVKKVVGTSKDIILSFTGKSSSVINASSGSKSTRVTSTEVPSTSFGRKRVAPPAAATAAPVKKKAAPMTLKDFNIDDIDDIIELE